MTKPKYFADLTEHPRFFSKTHWGRFPCDNLPEAEIVSNRNSFVREFDVLAFAGGSQPQSRDSMFDHPELYKCKKGYVFIVSPYDPDGRLDTLAMQNGLACYNRLYDPDAKTYIKQFSDKYEFNRWKKAH